MKVLFVNHWARNLGGAELSLLDIMAHTLRCHEAILVTSEPGPLVDRAKQLGVSVHVLPTRYSLYNVKRDNLLVSTVGSLPGLCSYLGFVWRLYGVIRREAPDVVHANVPKSHAALFLVRLLGYRGATVVHAREIFEPGSCAKRIAAVLLSPRELRIIAISRAVRENLPPAAVEKATVIHNGIAIPDSGRGAQSGQPVRFVYLGRVVPWKGCHLLIAAFAGLERIRPGKALLSIVGDTSYWDKSYRTGLAQQIARTLPGTACTLSGNTLSPYELLATQDIFCICSHLEPFGRSIAEAQACGLPVVAFDGGGVGEIVEDQQTGLLVPYGNVAAFTGALCRFVDEPLLAAKMGIAGRARAQRCFNRDIQMPKIVEFLERATAKE